MKITKPDHPRFINNYNPRRSSSRILIEQWRGVAGPAIMSDWNRKVVLSRNLIKYVRVVNSKPLKCRLYCYNSHLRIVLVIGCYLLQRRKTIFMAPWSPFLKKREVDYLSFKVIDIKRIFPGSKINPLNTLPRWCS